MSSATILIFARKPKTADSLVEKFSKLPYDKIIQIHHKNHENRQFKIRRLLPKRLWLQIELFIVAISLVLALLMYHFQQWHPLFTMLASFLFGSLIAIAIEQFKKRRDSLIRRYQKLVMTNETLIIVQCQQTHFEKFIKTIQKLQDEPLAFFSVIAEEKIEEIRKKEMLPHLLETAKELEYQALGLAKADFSVSYDDHFSRNFLLRVQRLAENYQSIYEKLSNLALYNENIQLSAEWLLENSYTVKQSISDVHKNLPETFFKELSFIAEGPYKGAPSLYPLVARIVAASDGRVTAENITSFLNAYQTLTPLTIGELWAFPLILKIRLIECLVSLTKRILDRVRENQLADFWANRILYALRTDPENLYNILAVLSKEIPYPSSYFADQLMIQLRDTEAAHALVGAWLQRKIGEDLHEIFHYEQSKQTLEQTSIANVISSLRRLEQMSWRKIFEKVSVVEKILSTEALGIYSQMDFDTKDRYRHVVEKLARARKIPEHELAQQAVDLTHSHASSLNLDPAVQSSSKQHVGYYLVDEGITELEQKIDLHPSFWHRLQRVFKGYYPALYLSGCALLLSLLIGTFYYLFPLQGLPLPVLALLLVLSLFPFSEITIQTINYVIAHLLPPTILPKMFYEEGIPHEYQTLVVMPTLLQTDDSTKRDLEKLEIQFLANTDPYITFGLLTDFVDAPEAVKAEDAQLFKTVKEGIKYLNEKYQGHHFYLFHRERKLNKQEKCWMGWERKRGKLENLNSYLAGGAGSDLDSLLHEGDASFLSEIRYVLTVDNDTQLPKDSIRRLIETLSHPLNVGHLDEIAKKITRGYTIIQPRVSTNYLSANATWFAKLFSDPSGIDPYTKSTSDIYQDLFDEGVYHGKGLYDHKIFHRILSGRFPENQILSHDLLEGAYVRTAFASDIEFYDSFPSTYAAYTKRQNRWIRGDWQLIQWLGRNVCNVKGERERNPLSLINKWKIFDNLRRSLVPIASTIGLLVSWFSPMFASHTALVVVASTIPAILQMLDSIWITLTTKLSTVWRDLMKGLLRALVTLSFLPHQVWMNGEAILISLCRHYCTRSGLLEWPTACNRKDSIFCLTRFGLISISSVGIAYLLILYFPYALFAATPLLILWAFSPFICMLLNINYLKSDITTLPHSSQQYLRLLARKAWRYFDDFVTEDVHWLPPDNYQEKLKIEVAYRTSPTNIGLYLMSLISAQRLGFITPYAFIHKFDLTQQTLKKLERYEGHFLNWYDIKTLAPLLPRYVSTVDSGNLLASFWTSEERIKGLQHDPVLNPEAIAASICDMAKLFEESFQEDLEASKTLHDLSALALSSEHSPSQIKASLESYKKALAPIISDFPDSEGLYWLKQLDKYVKETLDWFDQTLSWVRLLELPIAQKVAILHPEGLSWKSLAMGQIPTLQSILHRNIPGLITLLGWLQTLPTSKLEPEMNEWVKDFIASVNRSFAFVEQLQDKIAATENDLRSFSEDLRMSFLYNPERKLFSIGYNVSDHRLDSSYYDLLASEARLASFIAIAKGDVPLNHWWELGRPISEAFGYLVLQSWGGTMFEYLMPVIWCKNFANTLLDYACKVAVKCQIAYGNQLGIPWGISESAYSRLDIHNIYQYRAFGVPFLGLKQGLEKDFVITPYSSALALMVDPAASVKNIKRLDQKEIMNGAYGLYEAIDYSREYASPEGRHGVVVHAYMAHHTGMSLASFCNILQDGYLQNLFHSHPRVKALEPILYERPDISDSKVTGRAKERSFPKLSTLVSSADMSHFDTPFTPMPATHLLSNGNYSVMITNSGGGYSRFQDIDITRWRPDATRDQWGSFFYIFDPERNTSFSATYHPMHSASPSYYVNFSNHKAEIKTKNFGIEAISEIVVSPEDNVEIRCLTFSNLSLRNRQIEITSYVEIALAEHKSDLIHPSFSKMFIETEAIEQNGGLIAHRRKRSPDDAEHWCFHVAATPDPASSFSYETRRDLFLGKDRTLANPQKLEEPLGNSQGFVLDPIFSIRKKIRLEPGKRAKISFITGYASSREEAVRLIEKYKHLDASLRIIDMSWAHAELDLRRLHISHEDAFLFQRLASHMIYPDRQLRASTDILKRNRLGQDKLWGHGISGDNPIILVTIDDIFNLDVIHNILLAHAFWRLRGLKTDLVILNEERTSYEQPLNEHLIRISQSYAQYGGSIFVLAADKLHREELMLLFTVAHAVISAERGGLSQQLALPRHVLSLQPLLKTDSQIPEELSPSLPFLELLFFNGIGGFTKDGKEYAIYFENGRINSAPWINVIANRHFGCLTSARGLGMTWAGNSQTNRLTPWSNDASLNPITDIVYIRDDETGKFWTITPSPIVENDPFRTRHGSGYTVYEHNSHAIEQEMTTFVPVGETHPPIRVQILRLTNRSSRKRKLSIFAYIELTMGQEREESQRYIDTSWHYESRSLMAVNHYRTQFVDSVAFLTSSPPPVSFTTSRKEFIGRNQSLASPDALTRAQLSQTTGPGLDPCFALQTIVELYPNESTEVILLLGETSHVIKAKELCHLYQNHDAAHTAFKHTKEWWDQFLNKIHVQTPELSLDLIFNHWLTYQNLSCRMWGRSAFYQSGGAYGFRDQLQDAAALVYFDPALTKEHILKCAGRQFVEGDVQHWWHHENGSGVRTRISDDLLWLPYVALHYVQVTGDETIMEENIPYLEGRLLEEHEHEAIVIPKTSSVHGSLKEHCLKAIEKALVFGPHDLPLIGGGDWNDGMNTVGIKGKGESVWLAWFLIHILDEFSRWLASKQDTATAQKFSDQAEKLLKAVEEHAWDGEWYLRAFFDDGTPVGSSQSMEDKIDSLSQSWAVISGQQTERAKTAMQSVEKHLIDENNRLILLFTPPFDKAEESPGYIKGYPPGVRENGGQYTHAALWVAMALAKLGNGETAMHVLRMINPINRTTNLDDVYRYRVEPYVTAADIYSLSGQEGRGGWTWYTGSASLMYRVLLEEVFGFKLQGNILTIDPVIPASWDSFTLTYWHGEGRYEIQVENPQHVTKGVVKVELDSQNQEDKIIPLSYSGSHIVKITMG